MSIHMRGLSWDGMDSPRNSISRLYAAARNALMDARLGEESDMGSRKTKEGCGQRIGMDKGHLEDVEDGCGCVEVWEHLSEERQE